MNWGGLCILWKPSLQCSITHFSQNHIDVRVNDPDSNWRLIGFYGFSKSNCRKHSWVFIHRLGHEFDFLWMIIGDYNDIMSPEEKKEVAPRQNWLYNRFVRQYWIAIFPMSCLMATRLLRVVGGVLITTSKRDLIGPWGIHLGMLVLGQPLFLI